jgi:hypothetical protein
MRHRQRAVAISSPTCRTICQRSRSALQWRMASRFLTILTGHDLPKMIWQSREAEPSIINGKTIADFARVVEQTRILEREPLLSDRARPPAMDFSTTLKSACLCLACVMLSSCTGGHIADMPHWMGGLPDDAPPRRGSPGYDEYMAKRAQEAARPKTEQQQPK